MKKNIIKKLSILLVSLLIISILYFGLTFFVILNPKKTFNKLFNSVFDETSNLAAKLSIDGSSTSINKGNIKIDTNIEKYNNLKDYEIEYNFETDRKKNNSLVSLKLGDEEENLESSFYYEDNNLYIDFPYIISTLIKLPLNEYGYEIKNNKLLNYRKEDVNYLFTRIKTSFINAVNKESFKNSIDNNHIKSTYRIDTIEFKNILNSIVKDIKNDSKSMQIIKNEDRLNKIVDQIQKEFNKLGFIELNVFNTFLFKLDKITVNTNNNNIELVLNDTNKLTVKTNNNEILNSKFNNKKLLFTINRNSKVIESDIKIDTSRDEINLDGTLNYKDINNQYIKLDLSLSTLLNEDISEFDTTQAKSFNQFTSKDLKSVYKIIDIINGYIELLTGNKNHNIKLNK